MYDQTSEGHRNGFPEVPIRKHTETGSYSVTRAVAQRGRNHLNASAGSGYTNRAYSSRDMGDDDVFTSPLSISPPAERSFLSRFNGNSNLNSTHLSHGEANATRNNHSILSNNNVSISDRYPDRSWSKYDTSSRKDQGLSFTDQGYSGSRDHSPGESLSPPLPGSSNIEYTETNLDNNTTMVPERPEKTYLSNMIYHAHTDSKDSNPSHTPSYTPSQEYSGQGSLEKDTKPILMSSSKNSSHLWPDSMTTGQEILGYPTDSKALERSVLLSRDFSRTSSAMDNNTLTRSYVTNRDTSRLDASTLSASRLLNQSKLLVETPVISTREVTSPYRRNTSNSVLDKDYSRSDSVFSTLDRTVPIHKQNGNLSHSKPHDKQTLSLSKRSLNLSKPSLNLSRVTLYGKDYGVQNSLFSMGLIALLALAITVLALQLLFALNIRQLSGNRSNHTVLRGVAYDNTLEVTIALTSFIAMANLSCMVVTSMQCYFGAKLLKVPQGEERAFKYLKECGSTRFIAVTSFFISIPALLIVILLYIIMEFRVTPAVIACVIMGIGAFFCVFAVAQNLYYWRVEKTKADQSILDKKPKVNGDSGSSQNELSTLV